MRVVWLVFAGLLALMALLLPRLNKPAAGLQPAESAARAVPVAAVVTSPAQAQALLTGPAARADSVAAFGLAQRGAPYAWAGTSPLSGFDCSGFIMYTFARFGVAVPHSTALLIGVGRPVPRAEAAPGDIVVFTGTDSSSSTPGHAGIVVSGRGEVPLRFVHSSSARRESGVKVSAVEGTGYERRFMQVRRVLGPAPAAMGAVAAGRPRSVPAARTAAVAALTARPVAVEARGARATGLPTSLPTRRPGARARAATATRRSAAARRKKPSEAAPVKEKQATPVKKPRTPAKPKPRKRAAR